MKGEIMEGTSIELAPLKSTAVTIETRSRAALSLANSMIIDSDEARASVGEFIKIVKGLQSAVKSDRQDELAAAQKTVDAIKTARNGHLIPLQQAEAIAKQKVIAYDDAQTAKRRAEQEAEQRRMEQEAQDQALADAIALQEAGAPELAEDVLEQAQEYKPDPVILPKMPAPVAEQHTVVQWRCRLVNLDLLVSAVASGQAPDYTVKFDQVGANTAVKTIKEDFTRGASNGRPTRDKSKLDEIAALPDGTVLTKEMIGAEIPGVEIYTSKSLASSSY
jgi:hypothetical protein